MKDITNVRFGKLVALHPKGKKGDRIAWYCICDCGKDIIVSCSNLTRGYRKTCGNCTPKRQPQNRIGQKYGRLLVVSKGTQPSELKGLDKVWWNCICECGNTKLVRSNDLVNRVVRSCGCLLKESTRNRCFKGYKKLGLSHFNHIKYYANKRNIIFDISIEQAYILFEQQDFKCNITRIPLIMSSDKKLNTASLDRIDSNKGYTIDNVQWVHKDVNLFKWSLSMEELFYWSELIYKNKDNYYEQLANRNMSDQGNITT